MPERPLPIEQILTMLAEAPSRIAALTDGLTPEQLRAAPAPGEWSANEALAHLRACADVWGECMLRISQGAPTLRAVNPRTWIVKTDYLDREFQPSLRAYAAQRAELLAMLESLAPDVWARVVTITGAGKPLVRTVHAYAQWMATHERPHIKQIGRIAAVMRAAA